MIAVTKIAQRSERRQNPGVTPQLFYDSSQNCIFVLMELYIFLRRWDFWGEGDLCAPPLKVCTCHGWMAQLESESLVNDINVQLPGF